MQRSRPQTALIGRIGDACAAAKNADPRNARRSVEFIADLLHEYVAVPDVQDLKVSRSRIELGELVTQSCGWAMASIYGLNRVLRLRLRMVAEGQREPLSKELPGGGPDRTAYALCWALALLRESYRSYARLAVISPNKRAARTIESATLQLLAEIAAATVYAEPECITGAIITMGAIVGDYRTLPARSDAPEKVSAELMAQTSERAALCLHALEHVLGHHLAKNDLAGREPPIPGNAHSSYMSHEGPDRELFALTWGIALLTQEQRSYSLILDATGELLTTIGLPEPAGPLRPLVSTVVPVQPRVGRAPRRSLK